MKMTELPRRLESIVLPYRKENVLADTLEEFGAKYANHLLTIITAEQKRELDGVILLTYTKGKLTIEMKAQLWWAAADLIDYLQQSGHEIIHNQELFSLLKEIQHLLEPSFPIVTDEKRRESLYIAWSRHQNELKNSDLVDSVKGGSDQLNRWISEISKVLETNSPTKLQNHRANWAAGGLLETIEKLENTDNFAEIVLVLKRIQKITR